MIYKRYDLLTMVGWMVLGVALIVLGLFVGRPGFAETVWWIVMAVGIGLALVGIVSIVSTVRQPVELHCPHCDGKIIPRVKSSTGHLYLAKEEEEEMEEAETESSAEEEARIPKE